MRLQEAIKFKNKSRLLDKIEARIVSDFRKVYKPGKKVGIDLFDTVMYVMGKWPELIEGDPDDIGRTQIKTLLKNAVLKVHTFPFKDDDMESVFKNALIVDIKRLKSAGRM
ncbi:hypothetical protein HN803_02620 [candidate division WWE3 bacterium]|jgi:hypothetical protein|nr:hypothetical protein [candidate division WWE3 bacterium]